MKRGKKGNDGKLHYHKHYHNEDANHRHRHKHYHQKSTGGGYHDDVEGGDKDDGDDSNWSEDDNDSFPNNFSEMGEDEDDKKSLHIFIHKEKKDGNDQSQVEYISRRTELSNNLYI